MKTQRYLRTKKKSSTYGKDFCEICESNLYHDEIASKRIGILDKNGDVESWKCPFCDSEFDLDDNILYIYGIESDSGST